MAKLTWLGEDTDKEAGPSFVTAFGGIKFPKGHPVEVSDPDILMRARRNRFFEVDGPDEFVSTHPEKRRGRPPKVKAEELTDG